MQTIETDKNSNQIIITKVQEENPQTLTNKQQQEQKIISNNNLDSHHTYQGNSIQQTQVGTLISNNPSKFQESISIDESEQNNSILSHKLKIPKTKPQRQTFSNSENFERLLRSLPGMNKNSSALQFQSKLQDSNNNNSEFLQQFNTNSTYNNDFNSIQQQQDVNLELNKFDSISEAPNNKQQNSNNYYIDCNEISLCINYDQNKMFDFEAKRNRFLFLKKWDDKKKTQLTLYSDIVSALGNFISAMSKEASQTQNQLINYYKDRIRQDIQYLNGQTIKLSQIYKQDTVSTEASNITIVSNQDSDDYKVQITYPQISNICQQIDKQQNLKSNIISEFANQVEQKIIKEKLLNNFKDYDKKIKSFILKYKNEKQQMQELNKECDEKFKTIAKVFGEMAKANRKKKKIEKDFLFGEMDYIYTTTKYFEILKSQGEETVKFLIQLKQMEQNRLLLIQDSVEIYGKLFKQIYKSFSDNNNNDLDQSLENNNNNLELLQQDTSNIKLSASVKEELSMMFSMKNLLNDKQIEYISFFNKKSKQQQQQQQKQQKISQIQLDYINLQNFIENFQLIQIPDSPLILKELRALKLEDKKIDKKQKKSILINQDLSNKFINEGEWIDVDIIHTADNFLLITEGIFADQKKPIISLPVNSSVCKGLETDDEIIQIIHIKNRLIYKSKKYHTFQMTQLDKSKIQQILTVKGSPQSNSVNQSISKPKSFMSEPNQTKSGNLNADSFISKPGY